MVAVRDLVSARGPCSPCSTDCYYGYEGNVNEMDQFVTCHQTIYRPSGLEQYSVEIIAVLVTLGFVTGVTYYFVSARLRQKFILAKIEDGDPSAVQRNRFLAIRGVNGAHAPLRTKV